MKTALTMSILLAAGCATMPPKIANPMPLDIKIINGRILDGTGAPWFRGDIGIRGDRIEAMGDLKVSAATLVIDARDHIVSPGFIDLLGQSEDTVFTDAHLEAKIRQGVTTEITGEGHSPGPVHRKPSTNPMRPSWNTLGEYMKVLEKNGSAVNFAFFVGSSNPREMVIGDVNRPPTAAEMTEMEAIVDQAMRDGAIGLSTSLIYLPAMYSTTEEIINLARVAARYHGVYFSHMRSEGDAIDAALDETFRIGREAAIPVNIWHLKIGPSVNWGKMPHIIQRIVEARASGLDVAANMYPYIASGTSLDTLAPDWAMEGGYAQLKSRLADPESRARIEQEFDRQVGRRGTHGIYITRIDNPALAQYQKHYLEDIATAMGVTPTAALTRLLSEANNSPQVIYFGMSEEDVQYGLKQSFVSIGADSAAPPPSARAANTAQHPRAYGSFPRVLGHYVRDEHLFTIEEAVRKVTSLAADRVNITDRGILRPGMKADVVIFDPDTIRDVSTFEDPHHFSEGISDVLVNGVPVLQDNRMTTALPGRVLRGWGAMKASKP